MKTELIKWIFIFSPLWLLLGYLCIGGGFKHLMFEFLKKLYKFLSRRYSDLGPRPVLKPDGASHEIFLRWLILSILVVSGVIYLFAIGYFQSIALYEKIPVTYLTYTLFTYFLIKIGYFSWKIDEAGTPNQKEKLIEKIQDAQSAGTIACPLSGLIGTVIGILHSMTNTESIEKAKDLLRDSGMTYSNTIIGLSACLIIFLIGRYILITAKESYLDDEGEDEKEDEEEIDE